MDIICVADDFNRERAGERYGRKSEIVYYGVNHEFFSKGSAKNARKKFDFKDKFLIVQSGMITKVKNQIESIKAIEKIKDKIDELEVKRKELLNTIVSACGDKDSIINGHKLTKVTRAGSISYAKAIKDLCPDADLKPYTGKPTEFWKLS